MRLWITVDMTDLATSNFWPRVDNFGISQNQFRMRRSCSSLVSAWVVQRCHSSTRQSWIVNAVDTSPFFNVTPELGKGWMGTGVALLVLAIRLVLAKEEEGGLSALNAVGILPNGTPLSARENEE